MTNLYRDWFLASRPWSFIMTAISIGVGGAVAAIDGPFAWGPNLEHAVETAIDEGISEFRACYDELKASKPEASGEAHIHWKVFLNGDIKTPKVKESSLGSDDFKTCLVDVVKEWDFEMTGGGLCMVDVTLTFGK